MVDLFWNFPMGKNSYSGSCRNFIFIVSLLLVPSLVFSSDEETTDTSIRSIRVVMDDNYPPYVFKENDGKLKGILIDQWRLWEKKTGISVELNAMDWNEALLRMQAGEFDVIDTIFRNKKRELIYDFTKPYARIDVPVFFRSDISGIQDASDLKGFAVGVKAGDNSIEVLKSSGVTNLIEFASYEAIVIAANQGKLNVFTVDKPPALYFLFKLGIHDRFNVTKPLYTGEFHRAVLKGKQLLLEKVESGFSQISKAEYEEIEQRWYGTPILSKEWMRYISAAIVVIMFVLVLLSLWLWILRRMVSQRTKALQQEVELRIEKEKLLRDSNDRFQSIFNATNEAIFIHELPSGDITDVNQTMCEMFGYSRQEAIHLSVGDLSSGLAPYTQSDAMNWLRKAMAGEPQQFEWQAKNKSGQIFWVEIKMRLATIGSNNRIIVTARNITDRKQAEEEKAKLEARFQHVQRFEAIATLAGGIAHDFNNLLMGIQGRTSLISLDTKISNQHLEHIHAIEEYIKSATNLTKQLLGYAKGGKYEIKPIDMNELILSSSAMFGRTKKEIRIHRKCQNSPLVVEADRGQIEQVLLNMYVNAWQAMPPEGGELYLETKVVMMDAANSKPHQVEPGRYALISITDTGVGMDETTCLRAFDPFFTTKEMRRGTGLGLASAYGIIKNHGGMITVYSQIGRGTTFNIYLPVSDKEAHREMPTESELIRGSATILLVDDEEMIVEVAKAMLERLGYNVIPCNKGQEAIKLIMDMGKEIDLVILDLVMPEMDGGNTFDRIRGIQPGMPILLSSGYAINGRAQEIMQKGCNGFIQKPYSISDLSSKVSSVLKGIKS